MGVIRSPGQARSGSATPRAHRQPERALTMIAPRSKITWGSQMAKRKRRIAPKHTVHISLHASDLAKAGAAVTFKVHDRHGLLGTVEIGQGSFMWKGAKKQSFKRIPWTRLAADLDAY